MIRSIKAKRLCALIMLIAVAIAAIPAFGAYALTNVQLQLAGGLAAVHGTDTYFFAPTDAETWGLFSVSTYSTGPITTIKDVKPSKMVYADANRVYFTAVRSDMGLILGSLDLKTGTPTLLVDKVTEIYAETEQTVFYSTYDKPMTLYRYNFAKNTSSELKTMTSKNIYDSMLAEKDKVYFLGKDVRDGSIVQYAINRPGAKATNENPPSPNIGDGYLFGGYLVYSPKGDTTQVYSVPMGKTKGIRLGEQVLGMSLTNPRFADALYPFDAATNSVIRVPIDGSPTSSLPLASTGLASVIMGGAGDTIYYWDDGQIWSVNAQLQNKTPLFPFATTNEGVSWTNISPTTSGVTLMYGYSVTTYLDSFGVTLPTVVRVMDNATGQTLFQAPAQLPKAEEGPPVARTPGEPAPTPEPVSENQDISLFSP